jgi:hypothetical protein
MAANTGLEELYHELGSYLEVRDDRSASATLHSRHSRNMISDVTFELPVPTQSQNRERRIKSAQTFLSRRYRRIHTAICGNAVQRQKILQCDEASVVTVLADCLTPVLAGFPVFTVANLIARIGIKRLCDGNPFTQKSIKQASSSANEDSSSAN